MLQSHAFTPRHESAFQNGQYNNGQITYFLPTIHNASSGVSPQNAILNRARHVQAVQSTVHVQPLLSASQHIKMMRSRTNCTVNHSVPPSAVSLLKQRRNKQVTHSLKSELFKSIHLLSAPSDSSAELNIYIPAVELTMGVPLAVSSEIETPK